MVPTGASVQELLQAFIRFKRLKWYQANGMDYRPSEIRLLFCLHHAMQNPEPDAEGGMKVSDISQALHVTAPTVTQLVTSLESKRLVHRALDGQDRRVTRVTLTAEGTHVYDEARRHTVQWFQGLVEYLGEEESNQLVRLLSRVFAYVDGGDGE